MHPRKRCADTRLHAGTSSSVCPLPCICSATLPVSVTECIYKKRGREREIGKDTSMTNIYSMMHPHEKDALTRLHAATSSSLGPMPCVCFAPLPVSMTLTTKSFSSFLISARSCSGRFLFLEPTKSFSTLLLLPVLATTGSFPSISIIANPSLCPITTL